MHNLTTSTHLTNAKRRTQPDGWGIKLLLQHSPLRRTRNIVRKPINVTVGGRWNCWYWIMRMLSPTIQQIILPNLRVMPAKVPCPLRLPFRIRSKTQRTGRHGSFEKSNFYELLLRKGQSCGMEPQIQAELCTYSLRLLFRAAYLHQKQSAGIRRRWTLI